jgi:hypothetical protein
MIPGLAARAHSVRCVLIWLLVLAASVLMRADADAKTRKTFVSIGSDDWGRWSNNLPVFPHPHARTKAVQDMGWPSGGMPMLTTVETAADLAALRELLSSLNDGVDWRQRVVLTPFWVVAGPDFAGMRAQGCPYEETCRYEELFWHNSSGGLDRVPFERGDLRPLYLQLYQDGLWRPEYHGRSHFDTTAWVAYLKGGDAFARYYFEHGMTMYHWGLHDPTTNTEHTLHCEYLADDPAYSKSIPWTRQWLREGVSSFRDFWGYSPTVTAVPTHHAPEHLGELLSEIGIIAAEGNELDYVDAIPRFEIDLDSYLQLGGANAVRAEANRQRVLLRKLLESQDFVALQWHSQNALGNMYAQDDARLLLAEFSATVRMIRADFPHVVFVTAAELAQLRASGFSESEWPGCRVLRNYNTEAHFWSPPPLSPASNAAHAGAPPRLRVEDVEWVLHRVPDDASDNAPDLEMDGSEGGRRGQAATAAEVCGFAGSVGGAELGPGRRVQAGEQILLDPMSEYILHTRAGVGGGRGAGQEGEGQGSCVEGVGAGVAGGTPACVDDEPYGDAGPGTVRASDASAEGRARADSEGQGVVSRELGEQGEGVWDMTEEELMHELDEHTALYFARIHANKKQLQELLNQGRHLDVWRLGVELKRRADAEQAASLSQACLRCLRCRTCSGIPVAELDAIDVEALPFAFGHELFAPGEWQDRTAVLFPDKVRRAARGRVREKVEGGGSGEEAEGGAAAGTEEGVEGEEEVAITFLSPRFGDVFTEPALISVAISGYDFEAEDGYAVLAALLC